MRKQRKLLAALTTAGLMTASLAFTATARASDWDYADPASWGGTCASGMEQSPIDLTLARPGRLNELRMRYDSWALNVENNGHTVQVNVAPGSTLRVGDSTYYLLQYHFHARSEHAIDGQLRPMEMHLVHMNKRGQLAVVGVMIRESHDNDENETLARILAAATHEVGKTAVSGNDIRTEELLPRNTEDYWAYNGSLTTPPCSEGVKWHVLKRSIRASHEQIEAFEHLMHHDGHENRRPLQPINDRTLRISSDD